MRREISLNGAMPSAQTVDTSNEGLAWDVDASVPHRKYTCKSRERQEKEQEMPALVVESVP
jgi:hypothetical protein